MQNNKKRAMLGFGLGVFVMSAVLVGTMALLPQPKKAEAAITPATWACIKQCYRDNAGPDCFQNCSDDFTPTFP